MARQKTPRDPAQEITDYFIARLEEGVRPWVKPWKTYGSPYPLRSNGEPFNGINRLWLDIVGSSAGFSSPYWLTYKQAQELGGQVRKGSNSQLALFYKQGTTKPKDAGTFEPVSDTDDGSRSYRILRHYPVFNADMIDDLPDHFYPTADVTPPPESEHRAAIEAYLDAIPSKVTYSGNRACFRPEPDDILMPPIETFNTYEDWGSTEAHENIHWSGGKTRLNRTFGKSFGDEHYAAEELIAEIGSHLIARHLRLPQFIHDNSAAYIHSWLKILKGDKTAILSAASKAQEAFDYLQSFQPASVGTTSESVAT